MQITDEAQPDRDGDTGTLGKAMRLLERIVMADHPLRFTDILSATGQPRGTLHRQLSHLVSEGLLSQRSDLTYEPGLRLLTFAHRAWARNDLRAVAAPHLARLHEETAETVHLGLLRGTEIVYIDKVESRQTVRMESQVGKTSPVYCTGLGKAAMTALPEPERAAIARRVSFRPFTPRTHRSVASLMADLDQVAERGYAFDEEEHEVEIRCVAAPVSNADLSLVGGVSVTGPAYRISMEQLKAWSPLVVRAARAIAQDVAIRMAPRAEAPGLDKGED
ncbi:IclR family transcriptional regulator [Rhizobium sp. YIM 134829]|uniref:IclR family transcriptional regulator n=1 Tax=Rhizobium sp. YIM 134829 TaxID=3390453 RepID=UPI00397E81F7